MCSGDFANFEDFGCFEDFANFAYWMGSENCRRSDIGNSARSGLDFRSRL